MIKKIRDFILEHLKGKSVKLALKALLGSATMSGPMAWLVTFATKHLFDEVVAPLIKEAFRKGQLMHDKAEGEIRIQKIRKAEDENNSEDYWNTLTDL